MYIDISVQALAVIGIVIVCATALRSFKEK